MDMSESRRDSPRRHRSQNVRSADSAPSDHTTVANSRPLGPQPAAIARAPRQLSNEPSHAQFGAQLRQIEAPQRVPYHMSRGFQLRGTMESS